MIVGDPSTVAIESNIIEAYKELGLMALGSFVIHVGGRRYGRIAPDSSMLACSFGAVERRIDARSTHIAPFSTAGDAGRIASALLVAVYSDEQAESYFGIPLDEFCDYFSASSSDCLWAPDGDQAFDDGSYVLQFDVGDQVRVIAFKRTDGYRYDSNTLSDVWLSADAFYDVLRQWRDGFRLEWSLATRTGT
jgi:hypothetical protein